MEFDFQWLLIGLPVAFALGWMASRIDLRQLRHARNDAPRAYFEGLNLLLNEQQDKAIDAFIEAVQHDPDTTELHFALGNLFRRRGEFERAVRVHEHLLGRSDLGPDGRHRAQLALAQDFMKAGLFDRAEAAWRALAGTPYDGQAQLALLSLFERSREWGRAAEVARRLEQAGGASFAARIAHYECELAEAADAQQRPEDAEAALARALQAAPQAARPHLLAGWRARRQGRPAEAMAAWDRLRRIQPTAFLLAAAEYARAACDAGQVASARAALLEALATLPAVELVQALDELEARDESTAEGHGEERLQRLLALLGQQPSLSAVQMLLALPHWYASEAASSALRDAVAQAARPLQRYRCAACGFEAQHYFWQCPGCLSWDSYPTQRVDAL
ncbi:Lipopolysaccharide assembly protein B [Rubrivivax sp. A210]|uniref:lipopolysaccharide assembly protein LapB n=1 Tax=Rubrivivax sp. A210 TaxID=2772301 RepID=UPI0019185777|nr:lipopolysaccharide assembly protein LapB [Rubrivivax sp. A210]CAD5373659.1 Lipopolysaccharide assembly protein B [Rubrivivax sp. A210]